jgi:hypothetical protein
MELWLFGAMLSLPMLCVGVSFFLLFSLADSTNRPSSKGKPTDPKLREKVKEEIKQETNKDGGGKGQWSAWKVGLSFVVSVRWRFDRDAGLGD